METNEAKQTGGRPRLFSDLAITTALMVKRVLSMREVCKDSSTQFLSSLNCRFHALITHTLVSERCSLGRTGRAGTPVWAHESTPPSLLYR